VLTAPCGKRGRGSSETGAPCCSWRKMGGSDGQGLSCQAQKSPPCGSGAGGFWINYAELFYMNKASSAADQAAYSATLTCPLFAMAPELLVDATADRKGTLFVYLNLWKHGSGSLGVRSNSYPSVETQASQCRMDPKDVREARNWLIENGWLLREERPGSTPNFTVLLEPRNPPRKRPTPGAKAPPNKNHLTRINEQDLEPPLPPSGGNAGEGQGELITVEALPVALPVDAALSKSPESAKVPEPPPQTMALTKPARKPRFQPSHDLIPTELLPVHPEILGFWAVKAGARTQQAWDGLIKQLGLIQQDPQGGTDMVRTQLQTGIERAPIKPWLSVSYGNWRKFGMQQGTTCNRRPTPEENAAAAVAFIQARDARKAAAAAASQQTLLAEVVA